MRNWIKRDVLGYWSVVTDGRGKKFTRILSSTSSVHAKQDEVKLVQEENQEFLCVCIRHRISLSTCCCCTDVMSCVYMRKTCSCAVERAFICALKHKTSCPYIILLSPLYSNSKVVLLCYF